MSSKSYDYVIVGGGTAGCVLASRLRQDNPSLSIVIVEAGSDVSRRPDVLDGSQWAPLLATELNWQYQTVPQKHLGGRVVANAAGKALGGSTAINAGAWTRGDSQNYDHWGEVVNDNRWSYDGFLPYFRKIETFHDPHGDKEVHGFDGVIHMVPSHLRGYPLREQIKAAWADMGVPFNEDMNDGNPLGVADMIENRLNGNRIVAPLVYPLDGVHIMTETLVKRVIVQDIDGKKVATAIELADNEATIITARREVIVSAGAFRSPQILMLSGLGPKSELQNHGIDVVLDIPDVGLHLHDHISVFQWWKLKNPEKGLSIGSSAFNNPNYFKGNPVDFFITQSVPQQGLLNALAADGNNNNPEAHRVASQRSHHETWIMYVAQNAENPTLVPDGTHIMTSVICMLPTSRGSIKLADTNPHTAPLVDPNYMATEADRYILREGMRKLYQVFRETDAGRAIIDSETVGEGLKAVSAEIGDEDLDEKIRSHPGTMFHTAGTLSMGKVVDTSMRVNGVDRLRVVDASVIPVPLAGHLQNCVYAMAEQAADIILNDTM
ncbi:Pyranose dehydrogenase 3 [Talaromyces pinophilus]|nr:Pyranose dehydrogenase 3 [Talaromyces pinophilus]